MVGSLLSRFYHGLFVGKSIFIMTRTYVDFIMAYSHERNHKLELSWPVLDLSRLYHGLFLRRLYQGPFLSLFDHGLFVLKGNTKSDDN